MNAQTISVTNQSLEQINAFSESLIRESYLMGRCRSIWIVNRDDDEEMN